MNATELPALGFGLGLRIPHYAHIFEHRPAVDWFEIISENFMDTDGKAKRNLARIREHYPLVMHGVALSIGTVDPLNSEYLTKLGQLIDFVEPAWISDHLCWTGVAHKNTHDLLPVPYTEEALDHIVTRIQQVQDFLKRPIALENPSTYLEFKTSHIPEAEFIAEMAKRSGCNLLLDVNNVYVSCYNHRLDPQAYIDTLPLQQVIQVHLSGHSNMGTYIIDTHDDFVVDEVWALYKYATHKAGRTFNTMVEWDDKLPTFEVLFAELEKAREAARKARHYAPLPNLAKEQVPYANNRITSLTETQLHMQEAILQGARFDSTPENWIRTKKEFAAADQLEVYIDAYRYRLRDVTAEDYPVLQHYLGDDSFHALIEAFLEATPSHHFNIGRYAARLPEFIRRHHPGDAGDTFAQELAMLENAVSQLTDPVETSPLAPQDLTDITPENLMEYTLKPRAALQLLAFQYPVNAYYIATIEDQNAAAPSPQKSFVAVFRHEDVVWRMDLAEEEFHLLQKLFGGLTIGAALEITQRTLNLPEEALSANLSHWFGRWMRNGMLAA